jgi:hypothetical protein
MRRQKSRPPLSRDFGIKRRHFKEIKIFSILVNGRGAIAEGGDSASSF